MSKDLRKGFTDAQIKSIIDEKTKVMRGLLEPFLEKLIIEYYEDNNSTDLDKSELSYIVNKIPDNIVLLVCENGEKDNTVKNKIANWIESFNPRQAYNKHINKKMNLFK